MSVELHRADPKMRRLAPAWLLSAAVAGVFAIWALRRWLASGGGEVDGLMLVATGLVVVVATTSMALAYSLWQEGKSILREDRFPPSDMHTMHDVVVRHGSEARRYATWMRVGAVAAAIAGLGILAWGYRLLTLIR